MDMDGQKVQALDRCHRWAWARLANSIIQFEGWGRIHDLPVADSGPGRYREGDDIVLPKTHGELILASSILQYISFYMAQARIKPAGCFRSPRYTK